MDAQDRIQFALQDTAAGPAQDSSAGSRPLPRWLTDQQAGILTQTQTPTEPESNPIATMLTYTGAVLVLVVVIASIMLLRMRNR